MPRCGQGTNHMSPRLVSGFCQRCIYSAEQENPKQRKVWTKKTVFVRYDCTCKTFLPSECRLTKGRGQNRQGVAFKFISHSFSVSANHPCQNINAWWETSFKQDCSLQKRMNASILNWIIEDLVRFLEKLAALLDRDHKLLKGGERRKQNIPRKENAFVVMTLLISRLPGLSMESIMFPLSAGELRRVSVVHWKGSL